MGIDGWSENVEWVGENIGYDNIIFVSDWFG